MLHLYVPISLAATFFVHLVYKICVSFVTTATLQIRWISDGDKDVAALGDNVYRRSA